MTVQAEVATVTVNRPTSVPRPVQPSSGVCRMKEVRRIRDIAAIAQKRLVWKPLDSGNARCVKRIYQRRRKYFSQQTNKLMDIVLNQRSSKSFGFDHALDGGSR
jgi:hypothetical protein